jgi:hypothetical protein
MPSLFLIRRVFYGINLPRRYLPVEGEKAEQWRVLCERAAIEQDPQRLLELAEEISRLLEEKEQRLSQQYANTHSAD